MDRNLNSAKVVPMPLSGLKSTSHWVYLVKGSSSFGEETSEVRRTLVVDLLRELKPSHFLRSNISCYHGLNINGCIAFGVQLDGIVSAATLEL